MNSIEIFALTYVGSRRRDNANFDIDIAKRNSETKKKGARRVPDEARERVSEEKNLHGSGLEKRVPSLRELFDSRSQLARLGALRRDELARESRREEDAADYQARLNHSPDRADSFARHEQKDQGSNPCQNSEHEQRSAEHAEQEEWLLRERELEPHCDHVDYADRNATDSEFRLAGVPRIKRHRNLGNCESLRDGHDDHVAMPVRTRRNRLHHFPPVSLHRVQVTNRNLEKVP